MSPEAGATARRPAAAPAAGRLLRIQEAAAETGLTPRSIRYYEELGLLSPAARSDGAYRLYDADDLERLRFIRGLRDDAGFSLAEIGQLLGDEQARLRDRARFQAAKTDAERRPIVVDALERVDRQVMTLEHKIERLQAMIADARARRAHLQDHLADIDAGREPAHQHADAATARGGGPR
jgi:DNA-binding transcriptional MerR regulator